MNNDLNKRKERLFRRKDVTEWEAAPDQMRNCLDSLHNAELAFGYMLPLASKQVSYLSEESAFFTSQAYKETRRVTMINYTMAREYFMDMGEQVHKHIYDMNLSWGRFLDFYSDLNNARKAHEDNFVERQYIGEELVEPDEQPATNEDLIERFDTEQEISNKSFFDAFDNDGFNDGLPQSLVGMSANKPQQQQPHGTRNSTNTENMLIQFEKEIREEEGQTDNKLLRPTASLDLDHQ